ncbi:MAG: hypothetical protein Q9205_004842 [Flavoplaca limonia]
MSPRPRTRGWASTLAGEDPKLGVFENFKKIRVIRLATPVKPWANFSGNPPSPISSYLPVAAVPHVTIIRPVKGIEPRMYDCLAATFQQNYPISKLKIFFCISSRDDPAFPVLERLLSDFTTFDAEILVEEEDPNLSGRNGSSHNLGPNPKIRNMSRAYREAKGDIIWIIDCNVWVDQSVAGRLVDLLCGFTPNGLGRKYKFVHQLPLAVDISDTPDVRPQSSTSMHGKPPKGSLFRRKASLSSYFGGRLEEMFLSTSHAKFYTAISAVAVAPCIVGKSNMFRRSHLNALTQSKSYRDPGIDYFSENICEDHLIGDLLWKRPVPEQTQISAAKEGQAADVTTVNPPTQVQWGNHGLLTRSFAVQPTCCLPLSAYVARRTRWLRVRKFTVALATFVEHGTESLFCSAYGAFGLTTLPWCNRTLGISRTWAAFCVLWFSSVLMWCAVDSRVWRLLQSNGVLDANGELASWVRRKRRQRWSEWVLAWIGREVFAFPIWLWAVLGGVTVVWRGRRFWVGMDMKVHEIDAIGTESNEDMGIASNVKGRSKDVTLGEGATSSSKGTMSQSNGQQYTPPPSNLIQPTHESMSGYKRDTSTQPPGSPSQLGPLEHQLRQPDTTYAEHHRFPSMPASPKQTPNPPDNRLNFEGLRAIEDMNQSIQALSQGFQNFADAARALLFGGNSWDGDRDASNLFALGVPQRKGQQLHKTKGSRRNGSLPHPPPVVPKAPGGAATRRQKKLRLRQFKQSNPQAAFRPDSLPRLSPNIFDTRQDAHSATDAKVKVEGDGTISLDAPYIHPSRRSQISMGPIIGHPNAVLDQSRLFYLAHKKLHDEGLPPSTDAQRGVPITVQIKRESSLQPDLHHTPRVVSVNVPSNGSGDIPALEPLCTTRDTDATKAQTQLLLEWMTKEEVIIESETFSDGNSVRDTQAQRIYNVDEEEVSVSNGVRSTAIPDLAEIAKLHLDHLSKAEL